MTFSAAALAQAALWGTDPRGWADFAEVHNEPLFAAVLDAAEVGPETRLLDVGCGTGRALVLARERGAQVSGVDVTAPLLDVARERLPDARLVHAEMDAVPFADEQFDVVIGVNSFQFATDPHVALREAGRVLAPGGRLVASLFAEPERSQSTALHRALSALLPPADATAPPAHAPYLLSQPGNLEAAVSAAGFEVTSTGEVPCVWAYADSGAAVRGLLASAGGALAVRSAGRDAVVATLREAVIPFTRDDGSVQMANMFRWLRADKPARRETT